MKQIIKTEFKFWFLNYFLSPFRWSKWKDIDTFTFGTSAYLLQGKLNKGTNAKKFKVVCTADGAGGANIVSIEFSKLEERGLIDNTLNEHS
jgi:hypothetical protein